LCQTDAVPWQWKAGFAVATHPLRIILRESAVDRVARAALVMMLLFGSVVALMSSTAQAQQPRVYTTQLSGIFSELTTDHTIRVLERAERDNASALLITVNSPGGLDRAVRRLNHAILTSEIPVIAFVGPEPEAQALSGAFLITLAAHKTIMHPEATIGAAPPPGISPRISPEEREARVQFASEIVNRTAMIRERNADDVQAIFEEQLILTASEAVSAGIVDGVADDILDALAMVSGEVVNTSAGVVEINTEGARLVEISMTWWEVMLRTITHPSVAYALLSAGLLLLILELYNPGRLIAGIPAVICLILAFVALGNLPVSWIGLALLILATILFIAELRTPWIGVMGAFGLVAYVAGSLSFYRPWGAMSAFAPDVRVNTWVIVGTMVGWVVILLLTLRAVFRARRGEPEFDPSTLAGQQGVVIERLSPRGVVRISEQEWAAVSDSGDIDIGTEVIIDRMAGGILYVSPVETAEASSTSTDPSGTRMQRPAEPT
jgi:membrane-bound serine protease (ClpP class)